MNEREICYQILYDVHFNGVLSHIAIKKALDECDLRKTEVNKAFITRLINGEIEKHLSLMFLITHQASRPESKIKPVLRIIMAEALYQAIYMSVPTSAAVNEAVKLAKKHKFQTLSGFVNGVLRRCIASYEEFTAAHEKLTITDYIESILSKDYIDRSESYKLSVMYSCPEWLISHYLGYMSKDELISMLSVDYSDGHLDVYRLDSKASEATFIESLSKDNLEYTKSDITPNVYRIRCTGDIKKLDFFKNGYAIVQDPSSAREGELLPEVSDAKVLDICAAPGGKAIHAADKLAKHNGQVLACDLSDKKVKLIADTIKRCGMENITTMVNDARELNKDFIEAFDIVIADLPCSGLGVIFKKPDIKYKTTSDDIEELSAIQKYILDNVVQYVKKGGYIIYSTCTLAKQENEDNTKYLESKGFSLIKEETMLPNINQDGFYISVLKRK